MSGRVRHLATFLRGASPAWANPAIVAAMVVGLSLLVLTRSTEGALTLLAILAPTAAGAYLLAMNLRGCLLALSLPLFLSAAIVGASLATDSVGRSWVQFLIGFAAINAARSVTESRVGR